MKTKQNQHPYRRAIGKLRHSFVRAGLFSALLNLLMLTGPLYMLQIYDRVLASGSVSTLMGLFAIVVVLYAFLGVYEFMRARILSRAAYRFDEMTGDTAFRQLLEGRMDGSAMRDLELVRSFLSGPAIRGLFDVPWIPIFLLAVFIIHPFLGYLTLAGAGVVVALALINQWVTRKAMAQAVAHEGAERGFSGQIMRNAETVRALGMRGVVTRRWRDLHDVSLAEGQRAGERSDMFSAGSRAFRLLLQSMLLTAGAYLALNQQISAGMIVGTSILAGRALAPVDQVIGQWGSISRTFVAHRRLKQDLDSVPAEKTRISLPEPVGELRLTNVTKAMPNGAQNGREHILDQISFKLDPGDVLGVIGNSAAGKSSLARLLVGVWQPDSGEIRIDGATLQQWDPDTLGRHVGYLPQHVEMLPGTIAENISRFDPRAREKDIFAAAKAAGVHDLILGLSDGYATRVGFADQPLSGGQVQRIGLARAIYRVPKIVVLDEPNSHLDAHGDQALTGTIRFLKAQGATVIVMAHQPNLLAEASKVLILYNGKVGQFGPREEIFRMAMKAVPPKQKQVG